MAARIQRLHALQAQSNAGRFYLPELDGFRFLAFLSVFVGHLCLHFKVSTLAHLGAHGVDLFFTLSAYLLTELMLREKESGQPGRLDIKAFYIRRVLRIWPLYFTFLFVVLCAVLVYPIPGIPRASLAMYAAFLGDFPLTGPTSLLVVSLWSISLEEQFYLLWPHVMQRLTRRGVAGVGIALWLLLHSHPLVHLRQRARTFLACCADPFRFACMRRPHGWVASSKTPDVLADGRILLDLGYGIRLQRGPRPSPYDAGVCSGRRRMWSFPA